MPSSKHIPRFKPILTLCLCLICMLVSCKNTRPSSTPAPNPPQSESAPNPTLPIVSLTSEELDFFNNNAFFDNGNWGGMNIRNQFLTSFYEDPKDVDLFRLFYCGTGQETRTQAETQEILNDIIASVSFYPDAGCNLVTTDEMNQVLSEHMGLTLEETNKVGLDTMTYLPQRDLYFHFHGDTNYAHSVHFTDGERQGNLIRLYYRNTFDPSDSRDCVLTLQKEGVNYRFLSNQPLTTN